MCFGAALSLQSYQLLPDNPTTTQPHHTHSRYLPGQGVAPWRHKSQVISFKTTTSPRDGATADRFLRRHQHYCHVGKRQRRVKALGLPGQVVSVASGITHLLCPRDSVVVLALAGVLRLLKGLLRDGVPSVDGCVDVVAVVDCMLPLPPSLLSLRQRVRREQGLQLAGLTMTELRCVEVGLHCCTGLCCVE